MLLHSVTLKNFRGYSNSEITINKLSVIIGNNDVGKSTIIDALDIFFNDLKFDPSDFNVYSKSNDAEISCKFKLPTNYKILLDSSESCKTETTLEEEFLLNKDELLEIVKKFTATDKGAKESVYIRALHPTTFKQPLITLKIDALKKLIPEKEEDIDKRVKKELRQLIYNNTQLDLQTIDINIAAKDGDLSSLYSKIKLHMPTYMVFRSDRTNTDKDKEVNDTTKAITKAAINTLEEPFNEIKDKIQSNLKKLCSQTLDKLKEFDDSIAKDLMANIISKPLDSLFTVSFDCEDNISFNKRGSGVKRLLLLSFFLATAEKDNSYNKNIIYAIEEPETSQHPNNQVLLIEALKRISSKDNSQVIITTHTPEIVKLVDPANIIFVLKNTDKHSINVQQNDHIDIDAVINTLGILPIFLYKKFDSC